MSGQGTTHNEQPSAKPTMSPTAGNTEEKEDSVVKTVGKEYLGGVASEGGEKTVEYVQGENGQQQLEEAKAEVQGLWAKYCGCFSSA